MFIDAENAFATNLALSGGAFNIGTDPLTNVIDSGPLGGQNTPNTNAGRDWGVGYPAWIYLLFITAPTGAGATIDAQLVSSAAANLSSPNVMLDLTGGAVAITTLPTGTAKRFAMPRSGIGGTTGYLRFLGVNFIVATTNLSGGSISCFITRDLQDSLLYAAGFTVS